MGGGFTAGAASLFSKTNFICMSQFDKYYLNQVYAPGMSGLSALEKFLFEYVRHFRGFLMDKGGIEKLKANVIAQAEQYCTEHPRVRGLAVDLTRNTLGRAWHLSFGKCSAVFADVEGIDCAGL